MVMAEQERKPRGGGAGFLGGALAGLVVAAAAAAALSVGVGGPATTTTAAPGAGAAVGAAGQAVEEIEAPVAPEPETAPEAVEPEAEAQTDAAPEPEAQAESAVESGVAAAPPPQGAAGVAPEAAAPGVPESAPADAPGAAPASQAAPAPERAWRRHAAAFDAPEGAPVVAVALLGLEADADLVARAAALGAPLTAALDFSAPGAGAALDALTAAGMEALAVDAAPEGPLAGIALRAAAAPPPAAAAEGMLAFALRGDAPGYEGGPLLRPDMTIDAGAGAEFVFQALQEAARRAAGGRPVVVALSADAAALTALARWLAVTDAAAAPLTAAAR
jgi:hypothetical protein